MRILFLSYYFEPDLSAGSFRATALIKALNTVLGPSDKVDLVTTQPNRYYTFESAAAAEEQQGLTTIYRVKLPNHKNGFVDQALTFRHYAKFVAEVTKHQHYDVVVGTSSRLMTAVLASRMARKFKAKLYLDIRDIFVDTIGDVFPKYITSWAVPVFSLLESYALRRAAKVNLVSEGFKPYFEKKYSALSFSYHTNGIDEAFMSHDWLVDASAESDIKTILYAGNMGDGQGLHLIVPELARKLGDSYKIKLIGDGGKKTQLKAEIASKEAHNVELLAPVKRQELIDEYEKADILFLHLNDFPAFKKVLPSKIFEYAVTGKPVLAGVSGYAAEFVQCYVKNSAVFEPCNVEAAVEACHSLSLKPTERDEFENTFSRHAICERMALDIVSMAKN